MYLIRLDDASDYSDIAKWQRIEEILDAYKIKPLVGIIPDNRDPKLINKFPCDEGFWSKVKGWEVKGWTLALHGCYHLYTTASGGVNPVNLRSEFAGVPLDKQCEMIKEGLKILRSHKIIPRVFFAPSHTYDKNTLAALRRESNINIISDTVANDVYFSDGFFFVPVQSGCCRRLPLKLVTICLHPNAMRNIDFLRLEKFLCDNKEKIIAFDDVQLKRRKFSFFDVILKKIYFLIKRITK